MPHSFYNLLHIAGLVLLTLSIGGMLMHRQSGTGERPRLLAIFHGVGLFLILVAGFGMLARLGITWPWPGWVYVKVVLFAVLGGFPAIAKRFDVKMGWWVAIILIVLAAWTGIFKPF
ncbi:MAG: hypothetical protein OXT73_00255 [Bacteroidota bacterium]|nr:hypothetical protein [Bacteroidota bacterium]